MVKTHHDKAATMTCSVTTIKNTRQSTSSGLMKKETKCQRRKQKLNVSTEMVTGMTVTSMTVTATGMTAAATIMTVMDMAVMAHIPRLVL
eukprot:3597684-Ditylum_brightwellii.AAC.1